MIGERVFRPADLAARYGGEEFAIVMPMTDLEGACQVADRIRDGVLELRIPHSGSDTGQWVTLSVGVAAAVPASDVEPDWFLGVADRALYSAKRAGRNRIAIGETAEAWPRPDALGQGREGPHL